MRKYGDNHHRAKPMEYYETHAVMRHNFKRICKTRGWDFNRFYELKSPELYIRLESNNLKRKYYYYYLEED